MLCEQKARAFSNRLGTRRVRAAGFCLPGLKSEASHPDPTV